MVFVRLLHVAGGGAGQRFGPRPRALPEGGGLVFLFQCLLYFKCLFSVFLFNACCQFSIQIVARTRYRNIGKNISNLTTTFTKLAERRLQYNYIVTIIVLFLF